MSNVSYTIRGRHDAKGVNDAIKSMQRLKKAGDTITKALKLVGVGVVLKGIKNLTDGATDAFLEQNKAVTKFNQIIKQSNLNLKTMTSLRSELSRNNFFDDDSLNNAISLAAQMGLNEEQIENVTKAATDMAATGIMPLDQAVKTLSATYSGNAGQIKRLFPELARLTTEQLKNGEAVDFLRAKYDGFADSMTNTFSGRKTQFQNNVSDLKASIGGIIQAASFVGEGKLMEPIKKATDFILANKEQIIKFIINLPELAKVSIEAIWQMTKRTWDRLPEVFGLLGESAISGAKFCLQAIFELIKSLGTDILAIFDLIFGNLFRKGQDFLGEIGNKIIENINTLARKMLETPGIKQLYELLTGNSVSDFSIDFKFNTNHQENNTTWNQVKSTIENSTKNLIERMKSNSLSEMEKQKSIWGDITSNYDDITEKTIKDLQKILGKDLPEDLIQAIEAGETTSSESASSSDSTSNEGIGQLQNALGLLGQLGAVIQGIMSSNFIGLIIQFLGALSSELSEETENWSKVLNIFNTIADVVVDIIGPITDEVIGPLVETFEPLGKIIGYFLAPLGQLANSDLGYLSEVFVDVLVMVAELFEALEPIVQVLVVIISALNPLLIIIRIIATLIKTIANCLTKFFEAVGDAFKNFYKKIYDILDSISVPCGISISWSGIKVRWKSLASYLGMSESSAAENEVSVDDDSSSSSGSSASYTAARDIYVSIYYNNSYVNGDAREIALNLRDEIRAAEKLGL